MEFLAATINKFFGRPSVLGVSLAWASGFKPDPRTRRKRAVQEGTIGRDPYFVDERKLRAGCKSSPNNIRTWSGDPWSIH